MVTEKTGVEWYREHFSRFEQMLNGGSKSRVHAVRKEAMQHFAELGFPTTRDEEWRFTNVSPLTKVPFGPVFHDDREPVTAADVTRFSFAGLECLRAVFVDGHFRQDLSSLDLQPDGVIVSDLASALRSDSDEVLNHLAKSASFERDALSALNTAFLQDGAFVSIPDGVAMTLPIHIMYLSSRRTQPFFSSPRNLVVAGAGSRLSIVETYAGLSEHIYFTNAVSEIILGSEAVVEHDKLQLESEKAYHIGTIHVRQQQRSVYTGNSISLGAAIVRNAVTSVLDGQFAECTLNGLSLGTGRQLVDNHTVMDHASPNCASHEVYKSVLDGRAKGVFNGKIFVRKDAQKTDAKQTNKTLLLSDDAMIDTKPQLEIFADDVKCTHGATVGQLDDEQVFYLRSRGVGVEEARDILTFAFASDIIGRVHVEPLRQKLEGMLRERLRQGRIMGHGNETE
jgi:Fe-S cluster assembly protein SufD